MTKGIFHGLMHQQVINKTITISLLLPSKMGEDLCDRVFIRYENSTFVCQKQTKRALKPNRTFEKVIRCCQR